MEATAEAEVFAQQQGGAKQQSGDSGYSQKEAPELGQIISAVA
jgi:hypothetical protein